MRVKDNLRNHAKKLSEEHCSIRRVWDQIIEHTIKKILAKYNDNNSSIIIGAYSALKYEPKIKFSSNNKKLIFAYPKIIGKHMIYVTQLNEIVIPSIIFIPGLGFNDKLFRLGYGGGYFDRYFAKHGDKTILKIGVFYDYQQLFLDFQENYDIPLDCVITNKKSVLK